MSNVLVIKNGLMAEGSLAIFRDNLPNATGKHAEEAARRFAKMIYTTVCQSPDLQQCSVQSIIKAASISASLDLDIDPRGLAYLIPYGKVATFQIGYMGLIELAYRSGKVLAISAHCIYESEKTKVKISRVDGQFSVEHPFSYETPTGEIIAVYASAKIDGIESQTCVLRAEEVERLRHVSKAPNSPAWKNHKAAMYKKTAIRQLAKFLPKSILEAFSRAVAVDEKETYVEAQVNATEQIEGEQGSETISAEFEPKDETAAEETTELPDWMKDK